MAEETIQKKTGAERQAAFLVTALERASQQNGVLLTAPRSKLRGSLTKDFVLIL